ncbi:MAG: pyrroloquinoline quinone biosynthesis protein PqqB, partial [Flavobacteriaceae bacterium]|nr:pyrroloquinoline quinone biosynthesis protein PqqB [Flavobacteriaceae bacterium]
MKYFLSIFLIASLCISCQQKTAKTINKEVAHFQQYITVLGIAQDAGYPHIGCQKTCCQNYYNGTNPGKKVVSLGLVDLENKQKWLFEATPDMHTQLADLEQHHLKKETIIDGVFLTHAHIGHYTGLMYFGREALGKKGTKVYT